MPLPWLPPRPQGILRGFIIFQQLWIIFKVINMTFVGNCQAMLRLYRYGHMHKYSAHVPAACDLQLKDVVHVVLIPVYKEPIDKLRETLDTLKAQGDGMARRIVVVIATEERDTGGALMARQLHREYAPCFRELYCTMHRLERGELVGKSSNENWAARCVKHRLVDRMGIDINRIVVTTCDADTFFPRGFSAEVAWRFCVAGPEHRHLCLWQAPIYGVANMFDVKSTIARLRYTFIAIGYTTLAHAPMAGAQPFSCYTMSLALVLFGKVGSGPRNRAHAEQRDLTELVTRSHASFVRHVLTPNPRVTLSVARERGSNVCVAPRPSPAPI